VNLLASVSIDGAEKQCFAYCCPPATTRTHLDEGTVDEGSVAELASLDDNGGQGGSPTNIWPADRSWFVDTDWDLTGTKVSGATVLMSLLDADSALETFTWSRPVSGGNE
jgi:hypothetical protein